jgi:recombinational DNA repair ATPase RecF
MLKELHLFSVDPSDHFDVEFTDRLNIFTGDNGLGKSFLLDVVWWILTGNWVEQPAYPQKNREVNPKINCFISTEENIGEYESNFDFSEQQWRNFKTPWGWFT